MIHSKVNIQTHFIFAIKIKLIQFKSTQKLTHSNILNSSHSWKSAIVTINFKNTIDSID